MEQQTVQIGAARAVLGIVPPEDDEVRAPVFERKSLLQLCLPLFLYALLSILTSFGDQLLLSAYSQELAASVSMANQILGVFYDLSGLLGVGALIVIAQCLGRNEEGRARRIAVVAIAGNTLLGAGLAAVLFVGGGAFVRWANTPANIAADTLLYVQIIGIAMIGNGFLAAGAAVLRAFGHTLEILLLGVLGNALYLALEYALIFGQWGFPELGVGGAALSTLLVRGAGILLLLLVLKKRIGLRLSELPGWARSLSALGRLTRLSLPSVADNVAYNLYQLTMVSFIAVLGVSAVVTRSYVLTLTALLSVIIGTLAQGNEILVGYDKGAGDNAPARRRTLRTVLGTAGLTTLLAVGLWIFSEPLVGLFTKDPAVIQGARLVLLLNVALQPFTAASSLLLSALRAVGDVNVPVVYSLAITWGVALPLGYCGVTVLGWGVAGLWAAMVGAEAVRSGVFLSRWMRMRWSRFAPTEGVA